MQKELRLRDAFSKIKAELNDHLEAINENTDEINASSHDLADLNEKVEKLSERIDRIEMAIECLQGRVPQPEGPIILTGREMEVFQMLYSRSGDIMSYKEISRNLGLSEEGTRTMINGLASKGVRISSVILEGMPCVSLDPAFREIQAKKNIVHL